jgi:hypothetical protein
MFNCIALPALLISRQQEEKPENSLFYGGGGGGGWGREIYDSRAPRSLATGKK